jgi:hypothetical protein
VNRADRLGRHRQPPLEADDDTVILTVRIPTALAAAVDAAALESGLTRSEIVRRSLYDAFRRLR